MFKDLEFRSLYTVFSKKESQNILARKAKQQIVYHMIKLHSKFLFKQETTEVFFTHFMYLILNFILKIQSKSNNGLVLTKKKYVDKYLDP